MAVMNAKDSELHVAAAAAGPYACVGKVLSFTRTKESSEAGDELYVLCEADPIVDAGEDNATMEMAFLRDTADTNGQEVLRTAEKNKTVVYMRALFDGANGEQQPFLVNRYVTNVDANGTGANKFVNETMTLTSTGPATDVVAP
jgi:hypothetical protein